MSTTLEDLQLQWNKLQSDLLRAYHHFRLFRDIIKAYETDGSFYSRNPTFWNLTQAANRDAALHGLYKFFDGRNDTLTLHGFLAELGASIPLIATAGLRPIDPDQLKVDLRTCDHRTNERVRTLLKYRHNFLAHRNRELAMDSTAFVDRYRLDYEETVEKVFDQAIEILERYGYLFGVNVLTRNVLFYEDLQVLLADLDRGVRSR